MHVKNCAFGLRRGSFVDEVEALEKYAVFGLALNVLNVHSFSSFGVFGELGTIFKKFRFLLRTLGLVVQAVFRVVDAYFYEEDGATYEEKDVEEELKVLW